MYEQENKHLTTQSVTLIGDTPKSLYLPLGKNKLHITSLFLYRISEQIS